MNIGKKLRNVSPGSLSTVVAVVLSLIITFSFFDLYERLKEKPEMDNPGNTDSEENGENEEKDAFAESEKTFSDGESVLLGSDVRGQCAIVTNLSKMSVIAVKGTNVDISCGNTAVFMISLIASEKISSGEISAEDEAVCPASAALKYSYSASSGVLSVGKKMKISDLIRCMLYQSGSSFAYTLAVHISGSEEKFVSEMNDTAKRLGMNDTFYTNVCGEDDGKCHTGVYDLAVLMKYFLSDDYLYGIFTSSEPVKVKSCELSSSVFLTVENDFFLNCCSDSQAKADGIKGGKVGECGNSGWCVVFFEVYGKEYLSVVLNSRSPYSDALSAFAFCESVR